MLLGKFISFISIFLELLLLLLFPVFLITKLEARQIREQKRSKWYFVKHQAVAVCVVVFEDHLH